MTRGIVKAVAGGAGAAVLVCVQAAARLLTPFRLGRLLRSVSIPRMQEHKLRTSLTVLGIALGVGLLVAVLIVNDSIMRGVLATVEDISGKADLEVGAGSAGFDESLVDKVRAVAGVDKLSPVVQQVATLQDPRARGERLLVLGVDLLNKDDAYFRAYQSSGLKEIQDDPLPFLNSTTNILVSRELARRLGLKLHDRLRMATGLGTQDFDVWGFLDEGGVGNAFGGSVAVMYYQAMQASFNRGQNIDRIDIAVRPGEKLDAVHARLRALLGEGFMIEPPATKGERIARMLLGVRTALTMASVIALLVAAFLIHNTMAISVVQRKRELGILRALGTPLPALLRLLTLESALLGGVGAAFGLLLGVLLSRGLLFVTSTALSETYLQLAATEVDVSGAVLLGGFVTGVLFATVAGAIAARRAGKIKPVEALRTAGLVKVQPLSVRLSRSDVGALALLGAAYGLLHLPPVGPLKSFAFASVAALIGAGVLLIPRAIQLVQPRKRRGPGRIHMLEAGLARANLPRDIGRTTTTAAALMVGVAMATAFATFITSFTSTLHDWVEQMMHGDLFITNAASMTGMSLKEVPMADTLRGELLKLPEVESVRRLSVIEVPYRDRPIKLVSTDTALFAKHSHITALEGSVADAVAGWQRGAVTVSENFAQHFDVHRGDTVSLSTSRGTKTFEVAAVIVDYTSDMGSIAMDRSTYIDAYGDSRVGTYEVHLKAGADALRVRRTILDRYGSRYELFVLTNQELRKDIAGRVDQVFSLMRVLELTALIVAVLGIVNAQLANVIDRVREIGVLRAVGMLRKQVSRMVLAEAVLTGCLGAIVGVGIGLALGYVLLDHINVAATGWHFPYRVPGASLVELLGLTLLASAAAGFYPGRAAAQLVVTEALSYE